MTTYFAEERLKKVIAWRACSVTITLLATWIYTGSIKEACFFTMLLHVILVASHYVFETLWEKYV
tara:strand:- start:49 stop:243 length:195 start_codon:yes stop_codon:yes gene_type:complete